MMTGAKRRQFEGHQAANLEAATIIAADPVKYPPGSLMAIWAAMVLARTEKTAIDTTVGTPAAGPIFETQGAA